MDKRKVEKVLRKKGFRSEENHHHYFIYHALNGTRTTVKTRTSHSNGKYKSLGPYLISQMARQCKLSKDQFQELIECTLDRENYEEILIEKDCI